MNTTTTTLNNTLVGFYAQIEDVVGTVFNGTVLEKPANDFIYCLIGTKIDAIENALTFLNENLAIQLPKMNESALMLNQKDIDEASKPIAQAAVGSGTGDENDSVVGKIVNSYVSSLYKQRLMYAIFLGLWCFVVLMGLCIILWHTHGRHMLEERRRRKYLQNQAATARGFVVPFTQGLPPPPMHDSGKGELGNGLRSFTPLPSPKRNFFSFNRSTSPWRGDVDEKAPVRDAFADAPRQEEGVKGWAAVFKKTGKLVAPSRKGLGQEVMVPDDGSQRAPRQMQEGSDDGWYSQLFTRRVGHTKPELRISVDRAANMNPEIEVDADADGRSRWSASPVARPKTPPRRSVFIPWLKVTSPTTISSESTKSTLDRNSDNAHGVYGARDSLLPPPRHHSRTKSVVPVDVMSEHEQPTVPVPLAPPLHYTSIEVGQIMPPLFYPNNNGLSVPPAVPMKSRQSLNPFLTPFDDEHHVTTVDQSPRRSLATNPFVVI